MTRRSNSLLHVMTKSSNDKQHCLVISASEPTTIKQSSVALHACDARKQQADLGGNNNLDNACHCNVRMGLRIKIDATITAWLPGSVWASIVRTKLLGVTEKDFTNKKELHGMQMIFCLRVKKFAKAAIYEMMQSVCLLLSLVQCFFHGLSCCNVISLSALAFSGSFHAISCNQSFSIQFDLCECRVVKRIGMLCSGPLVKIQRAQKGLTGCVQHEIRSMQSLTSKRRIVSHSMHWFWLQVLSWDIHHWNQAQSNVREEHHQLFPLNNSPNKMDHSTKKEQTHLKQEQQDLIISRQRADLRKTTWSVLKIVKDWRTPQHLDLLVSCVG